MDRIDLLQKLSHRRLVAVVRSKTADEALALACGAVEAGIRFVEITMTVPGALSVIDRLVLRGDLHVGAGTVLSKGQAEKAIAAGAQFVVSPSLELDLIPLCRSAGVPCFPGAATPTEVLTASRAGADLVKIFPADLVGGPDFIRQMLGPFPDVRFMVSGGVNKSNVQDYVRVGVIGICLGSAFLSNLLSQQGLDGFIREIRNYNILVEEAKV
ncbi:MAG: bifunctional 4-hydroxy-2-oxoglutarate aldolase/2-dehydro-3-deoxy-phosphogluconate aldolase [Candidatus Binatia bacterium]